MEPSGHGSTSWDPAYVAAGNWLTAIPKASRRRHWPNTTSPIMPPLSLTFTATMTKSHRVSCHLLPTRHFARMNLVKQPKPIPKPTIKPVQ